MKKITDFIVEKKYYILVICIILSGICLYLNTKVNINYDIAAYLPSSSETRKGLDIMESEFPEINSSSLNIMFDDLDADEKEEVLNKLMDIDNVSSVDYDNTEEHNIDNHTLYIVNMDYASNSKQAEKLYNKILKDFKKYDMSLGGSIHDSNKPVLKIWIVVVAITFAMIILIIMCSSYIEPFLFLFVIGLAVFINKGTNIIFPNVSHVTNAICAILQMALSMDYSIMLMNRYSSEREKEQDKNKAMKKALYSAFKSISSSSVTTIVGLLALVFMSFTIGRDLGFVLAKGVLFSLICIFLCLPGLILLFDKLILKTKKKSLNIKLDKLGDLSYKVRYPALLLFIILLVGSFFLKSGLGILYTDIETDKIAKYFKENNQVAVIYNNEYENDIKDFCANLDDDKVTQILCYSNTINDPVKYDELNAKINSLGMSTNISDYIIKLVYFDKLNTTDTKISLNELINFIEKDIYTNDKLNANINADVKSNLKKLKNFTSSDEINKKRTSKEVASILGLDEETIKSLFILYNAQNINIKINASDFVNFLNKYVLTNPKYSQMLDSSLKTNINTLAPFTDKNIINKQMNKNELSKILGSNASKVDSLLLLYYSQNDTKEALDLLTLVKGIEYLKSNTNYLDNIDTTSLTKLIPIMENKNNINNTQMNETYLTAYFKDINPALVSTVYTGASLPSTYLMTPEEFIDFTLENFNAYLTKEEISNLKLLKFIINDTNNPRKFNASEVASLLNIDIKNVYSIYALILANNNYEFKLSPNEIVNVILANKDDPLISSSLNKELITKLQLVTKIMDGVNKNISYTASDLAKILNLPIDKLNLMYSLYDIEVNKHEITPSLDNFINFMLDNVVTNKDYNASLDAKAVDKLKTINSIIKGTLKNEKYTTNATYKLLSPLTNSLDKNLIELIYSYYGSVKNYNEEWTLTIEEFILYLNDNVLNNEKYQVFIDDNLNNRIKIAKNKVVSSKNLLKTENYSRLILNTEYSLESKETYDFIADIQDKLDSKDREIYVIGDSAMAYDMSQSFDAELNFITILTMLAIFVVVAITFKSGLISLILVLIIQCAVYITMSILAYTSGTVYFIAILIVQSILMGATIDYAIVYTSYYKEYREKHNVKESLRAAYNKSIHTILTSSSILIIITLVVGNFASAIAAKICLTLSEGTVCSVILILFILPSCLAASDRIICRDKYPSKNSKAKK